MIVVARGMGEDWCEQSGSMERGVRPSIVVGAERVGGRGAGVCRLGQNEVRAGWDGCRLHK